MKKFLVHWGLLPEGILGRREMVAHFKKKGWRWLVVIVAFYAVRDVVLYILLPYLAFKSLTGL
ncbi:MAG TPA: hypothetical protein VI546_02315 [candidate division Zixibacteria bacterium]|nr:hypothetical protein [candidate division Zixibacteria bacterium]